MYVFFKCLRYELDDSIALLMTVIGIIIPEIIDIDKAECDLLMAFNRPLHHRKHLFFNRFFIFDTGQRVVLCHL